MSIPLEKARDLGSSLAQSEEYKAVLESQKALAEDPDALGLLQSFEKERAKLQNLQALGMQLPPSALAEIQSIQEKIQTNGAIQKLVQNQRTFDELLRSVNMEINKQIDSAARAALPNLFVGEGEEGEGEAPEEEEPPPSGPRLIRP
jgi:cell fate (sporulation/competence/biofilm development) regulator YlbF (YheA/YmcA/DUF963 family)